MNNNIELFNRASGLLNKIAKINDTTYVIQSKERRTVTTDNSFKCNCPHFLKLKKNEPKLCKHIIAIMIKLGIKYPEFIANKITNEELEMAYLSLTSTSPTTLITTNTTFTYVTALTAQLVSGTETLLTFKEAVSNTVLFTMNLVQTGQRDGFIASFYVLKSSENIVVTASTDSRVDIFYEVTRV